jgi:hypothetical protein
MTGTRRRNGISTAEAARRYIARGLCPIPLYPRTKKPEQDDYLSARPNEQDVDQLFAADSNIGLLTGEASRLIDIDLDAAEAGAVADALLPSTGMVFGRGGKPRSHRLYRPTGRLPDNRQFKDITGAMLVELRGDRLQTMVPPSIHPDTGERVEWVNFSAPGGCTAEDLEAAVRRVAAAAILARHWPAKGSRDDAAMALTGGLLRDGWSQGDVSRFVEAVAVAAGDEEAGSRSRKAAPTARKQEDGKKTTGWPKLTELLGTDGPEVVRRVRDWLGLTAPAQVAGVTPEPLPWPDPPGDEAFHGLAGRIVRTIGPASEADTAALLVQSLVAFGNVIGRGAHFQVEADRHHGNEFAVLVGRTSKARKGTSWGHVERLFQEVESQWAAEHVATGLSSGQGVIWHVRDPITKRERIKEKGQVRYEEVEADPGVEDKRLLIVEPEFASCLKLTEQKESTLSAVLRNAWDGRGLRILNKNSPTQATGAHVSMIGHITGEELRRYLTQTEKANGFGNRHVWVCTDRSKLLPLGGQVDSEALTTIRGELVAALAFAKSAGEVKRDEPATALWCEVYGTLSEGKPGLAGALLARAEAHVMRLAMLYALLDRSAMIQEPHLAAALAVWDYCERSVYFVFGDDLGDPIADDLLRWLRSCPNGLTRTDMMHYFGRHQSSDRIGRALGLLLQHHLVRREEEKTGGRPAERWYAVAKRK